jgi:hypothetical protein
MALDIHNKLILLRGSLANVPKKLKKKDLNNHDKFQLVNPFSRVQFILIIYSLTL